LYKQGFIDLSGILQAAKCHAASSEGKEVANPSTMYNSKKKKVLIVDDEPDVNTVLKMVLDRNGFDADSLLCLTCAGDKPHMYWKKSRLLPFDYRFL
jgi:hypothetical protein